jgi:hypothetical protein
MSVCDIAITNSNKTLKFDTNLGSSRSQPLGIEAEPFEARAIMSAWLR